MNKALIVIDVQNGLTLKKKLYQVDSFFNAVNLAIDSFRASHDLVIFVQHNNKMLINGTDDWQLDERLIRNPDDLILQKQNGNAFLNTKLGEMLTSNNITKIIVCGLVTHGCVRHTCLGAKAEGFSTAILSGGHTSWHAHAQQKIDETETELAGTGIQSITII